MKKFKEFINEEAGVRDLMTPKPKEKMIQSLKTLSPYQALATAKKYELTEAIPSCLQRTKPLEDKLYNDTKGFNKSNLDEFMTFMDKWIRKQGGDTYYFNNHFQSLCDQIKNESVDDEDQMYDEEDDNGGEDYSNSIYSDRTVELFKQLAISYAIDELSVKTEKYEDDEDGYDEDEILDGDEDEDEDELTTEELEELEEQERLDYEREQKEKEEKIKRREELTKAEDARIERIRKRDEAKKEAEAKKPINKIKKFLGFDEKV